MLQLCNLSRSFALKTLAEVISADFSISSIEEEKRMLFLIFNCVELASTCCIGFIDEVCALSQIADSAIITCKLAYVVSTFEVIDVFACHSCIGFSDTSNVISKFQRGTPLLRVGGMNPLLQHKVGV